LAEARSVMRESFGRADVGITGANFLVAETGSAILVTNEGNADLSMTLPKTHIVLTSIEKLVPTFDDALVLLRLLARSATGQAASSYMSLVTGPRRAGDLDGPDAFHVVLLDNGRTKLLAGRQKEMLRCIRCGACMNHCPVYGAIGGHAYGWVYPGPMGSVLTPSFVGLEHAKDLPNASTFCGKCDSVCPVRIPLTRLMRNLREEQFEKREVGQVSRFALAIWGALARRPALYRWAMRLAVRVLAFFGGRSRMLHHLPLAGAWTDTKDFPTSSGRTFVDQWRGGRR
jgi:L-lactate dehydrogenase complex protein LldF